MSSVPRILIVDDDCVITHLICLMLQKKGYNIVGKISSGEDAVLKAADLNPDLVLMDISLSGQLNGITAARYIFQFFHYPIIFITGNEDEKLLEDARFSQPYGIIFKPFKDIELKTNVDLALYNHGVWKRSLDNYPIGDPKKIMELHEVMIVMDLKGRIVFFNPYTAWFIDLPESEILMCYWRDVLMLINDQSGEQLKDPITEVAQQSGVVIYDSNTAVVTKTGKRRKAGVLVQPLRDEQGKVFAISMKIKEKKC